MGGWCVREGLGNYVGESREGGIDSPHGAYKSLNDNLVAKNTIFAVTREARVKEKHSEFSTVRTSIYI